MGHFNLLGVEPTGTYIFHKDHNINVVNDYFNLKSSQKINSKYGKAKIITTTNVFAHTNKLGDFIKYKANDYGKAVVEVNPAGTSQTCHVCGEKNTIRPQQDTLICLNGCGTFHADDNAGIVVAQRAVPYIQESTFAQKAKTRKKTAIRKKAASPPLGNELTSTEKSGELETASNDVSLARSRSQADIRPSSTASLAPRNSLTTMDTSEAGVLETR